MDNKSIDIGIFPYYKENYSGDIMMKWQKNGVRDKGLSLIIGLTKIKQLYPISIFLIAEVGIQGNIDL
ncbi:hypothetical protein [Bacillus sp. TL12]|uniref:hypothetical protein n=1 Tax=Bacillus sp. TL12 TaxID=2894756 RepID=UPI001F5207B9|nr:hypothetical protein [Bacillus sp. TL12]MCI0768339.1 hypothetical protein [Bacillus sp. TL12]